MKNREILFMKRPDGEPTDEHLSIQETAIPELSEGEALVRLLYVSVDPYMRGRMNEGKSYVEPFQLNQPIEGGAIAEVIKTQSDQLQEGDIVTGSLPWREYTTVSDKSVRKIDPALGPITTSLHILGMTGLTAYFGLMDIGQPQEGETVVVSGAAGAVGSTVVQIATIAGARVVGIAGSDEKIQMLRQLGADAVINYRTEDVNTALIEACPDGVDVYFDNVGGDISDAVYPLLNKFARIIQCGAISSYNKKEDRGPRIQHYLIKSSALIKGFTVGDYRERYPEGFQHLSKWLQEGKLTYEETITEGFENIPQAFFGLFTGENIGKQLVKVNDPSHKE